MREQLDVRLLFLCSALNSSFDSYLIFVLRALANLTASRPNVHPLTRHVLPRPRSALALLHNRDPRSSQKRQDRLPPLPDLDHALALRDHSTVLAAIAYWKSARTRRRRRRRTARIQRSTRRPWTRARCPPLRRRRSFPALEARTGAPFPRPESMFRDAAHCARVAERWMVHAIGTNPRSPSAQMDEKSARLQTDESSRAHG